MVHLLHRLYGVDAPDAVRNSALSENAVAKLLKSCLMKCM